MRKRVLNMLLAIVTMLSLMPGMALTLLAEDSSTDTDHEHVFELEIPTEDYLKSAANCTDAAVYYKSCVCGEKGTETFEFGESLGGHITSAADCTTPSICMKCHNIISPALGHMTSAADCTTPSICLRCRETISPALGHDFSEYVSNENGTHKVVCKECGAVQSGHENDTCIGGTATCQVKAKCAICSNEYGSLSDHAAVIDKAVAAAYGKTGLTEGSHCSVCGKVLTAQTEVPMLTLEKPEVTLSATSTSITVKWSKITGAIGYQVYRKTGNAATWGNPIKTITSGSTVSYTDTTCTGNTRYQYKVCAIVKNSAGTIVNKSAFSPIKTQYIVPQPKISSITNTSTGITVKWGKVSGATAYRVYRKVGTGEWKLLKTVTGTSYTNTSLTNGTKYQYKIVAVKMTDTTNYKSEASTSRTMFRLKRPTISTATNSAVKRIRVTWNKNTKATGYQVKYVKGKTTKTVKVTNNATLSKTLRRLTRDSDYKVFVRSYKTVGNYTYYSAYSAYKSVKVE